MRRFSFRLRSTECASGKGIKVALPPFKLLPLCSRFPSEGHQIIKVDQIHPSLDIFAGFGKGTDVAGEKNQRFSVALWRAPQHVFAPLFDFPRGGLVTGARLEPLKNFAVAFSGRELFEQSHRIEAEEIDN